jgi:hypothetical protein
MNLKRQDQQSASLDNKSLKTPSSELIRIRTLMENFSLDEPTSPQPFSEKLRKDHGWSREFTHRAIDEYKRFIVLLATCSEEVTPSTIVDQVWHKHLTYTKSYWDGMCRNILKRDIHHEPGGGSESDNGKYQSQYRYAHVMYERTFEQKPPKDIWPISEFERRRADKELAQMTSNYPELTEANLSDYKFPFSSLRSSARNEGNSLTTKTKSQETKNIPSSDSTDIGHLLYIPVDTGTTTPIKESLPAPQQEPDRGWFSSISDFFHSIGEAFGTSGGSHDAGSYGSSHDAGSCGSSCGGGGCGGS